jgi:predicted amidophosphoribosyltransferase
MTKEKFEKESTTIKEFISYYCHSKHKEQIKSNLTIQYQQTNFEIETHLCKECQKLFMYSIERLQNCSHQIKPRCRKCPNPCYEKVKWKKIAKIMIYNKFHKTFYSLKDLYKILKKK